MSKKIIAILSVITILFVCVFAACDKNGSDDSLYVTDENGERVLGEDGQFLVYETNAEGEIVTDESGENVTDAQMFEPTLEDGVLEDYGFKLTIPEGWKQSKEEKNIFVNKDKAIQIDVLEDLYDEYFEKSENAFEQLLKTGIEGSIKEDDSLVDGAEKAFNMILYVEDEGYSLVAFSNNGNLYVVSLKAPKDSFDVADVEAFLKGFEFKPYTYYPELTAESTEESTEEIRTEATTK